MAGIIIGEETEIARTIARRDARNTPSCIAR